jgi:spermidine synthase
MIEEQSGPPARPMFQYLALALISGSVLAYELFVMRVFACAGWSHFGSFVISIAMLGFGVFSTILCIRKNYFQKRLFFWVKLSMLLLGPSMAVCNALAQRIDFNPIFLISDPNQKYLLGSYFLIYLLPFLLGAMFIGLIFLLKREEFGTAYFANMAGSALGGAAILLGMYCLMPEKLLLVPLALWLPGVLLWFGSLSEKRHSYALIAFFAILSVTCALWMDQVKVSQYKAVSYARQFPDSRRVGLRSSPFGILEIYFSSYFHFAPGLSDNATEYLEEMPRNAFLGMYIDGDGPMGVMKGMTGKQLDYFNFLPMSMPFLLKTGPEVLVVQFGGGMSTSLALKMGATEVTVAEGNPLVIQAVRDDTFVSDFTGRILNNPNVRLIENDGRIYVSHTEKKFDLIDISLADSTGLSMPGGSSIQEKFTYTTETLFDCIKALRDDGILSITVWNKEDPPKSTLKLAATLTNAAVKSSPEGMHNRFFVAHNYLSTFTVLYKKDGFTAEQTRALLEYCARMSFEPVYYPGAGFGRADSQKILDKYRADFFELQGGAAYSDETSLSMGDLYRTVLGDIFEGNYSTVQSKYIFNFEPLTNDRPYFAGYTRSWDLPLIFERLDSLSDEWGYLLVWATLLLSCFFGLLLLIIPILSGWRAIFSREPGKIGIIVYFICLGIGYIAVEIAYISKCILCLGNPAVSFAVLVTGMVLFSGVGSYVSGKLLARARIIVPVFCAAIAVMLIFYAFGLDRILSIAGVWPYEAKVMFCLVLLLPLAFLLGFPFAMGMTVLSKTGREHFFVWAWGINGSFSVVGSVMVPVVAVNWGFLHLLLLCAALYLTAIPCFLNFQIRRFSTVTATLLLTVCVLLVSFSPGHATAVQDMRAESITFVAEMTSAPFPYDGTYDDSEQQFFDWVDPKTGERSHTNRYGQRFSETEHYSDSRVFFHLPPNFSPERPFALLVFFHGINSDILNSDREYQIAEQVDGSGKNVILILPQLAKNAVDSSPGKFFKPNTFRSFMLEAAEIIGSRIGRQHMPSLYAAPILLSAFSGGYKSAAYVLDRGGESRRICGVFVIDALYEDLDKFGKWIKDGAQDRFFIALYTQGTEMNTIELADRLSEQGIQVGWTWPGSIVPGTVNLIRSSNEHLTVPLLGPPERPVSYFLGLLDRRFLEAP